MASAAPLAVPTARDLDVLRALDRSPLTVRQLLALSQTFASAFTTERKVRARLQRLAEGGQVRRWQYAVVGHGTLNYYTLGPLGYQLLYGHQAPVPSRRAFRPVAPARLFHTQCLAEFLVQTALAARQGGIALTDMHPENSLRLETGCGSLSPDAAFTLRPADGLEYRFFVELDNSTEPVRSAKERDSWERKLRLYEAFHDACGYRFRVLGVFTRSVERLQHVTASAGALARNPQRSLFYAITLSDYLAAEQPLLAGCFRDHRGAPVALLPTSRP